MRYVQLDAKGLYNGWETRQVLRFDKVDYNLMNISSERVNLLPMVGCIGSKVEVAVNQCVDSIRGRGCNKPGRGRPSRLGRSRRSDVQVVAGLVIHPDFRGDVEEALQGCRLKVKQFNLQPATCKHFIAYAIKYISFNAASVLAMISAILAWVSAGRGSGT
jgi:hypothetical protein